MINRRHFIKSTFSAGLVSLLPFPFAENAAAAQALDPAHPIQMLPLPAISSRDFTGDVVDRTHDILWDIEGFMRSKGGWPEPTEQAGVVVVGGGVAGLSSAYFLRNAKPILLEQAPSFGGNSRGEQLGGSRYSIGAAYLAAPEAGSVTANLLKELRLGSQFRVENPDESKVLHGDRLTLGFWEGNTAPEAKAQFLRIHKTLQSAKGRLGLNNRLDQITFAQWLTQEFGVIHPHIVEYFQLYAWSSFAGSIEELSALQVLDFLSSDTGPLLAFPGGNSAVTAKLYETLKISLGPSNLRSQCMVVDVRLERDGARVTYIDRNNQPRAIFAKRVVYAAPKFVAQHTIRDIPANQKRAMAAIRYRSYVVANLFLRPGFRSPSYELFCLENEIPAPPSVMKPSRRGFTDVCFGTWAQDDQTQNPVITIYKAFPYEGARQILLNPASHNKVRDQMVAGLGPLFKSLGLTAQDIRGMRMTRWGHALPVASPGLIASGTAELASIAIAGKIFFANQDNWANPCFETAAEAAFKATSDIRASV